MRFLPIAAAGLTIAVVAGAATASIVGASRSSSFSSRSSALEERWSSETAGGVPASEFTPLRQALDESKFRSPWWSPTWWSDTGSGFLDDLDQQTAAIWNRAMSAARETAQVPIDSWATLQRQLGRFLPKSIAADASTWPGQLQRAQTPAQLTGLTSRWTAEVAQARKAGLTAQAAARRAALNAQLEQSGGVSGLLSQAESLLATARADNLDTGKLSDLIAQLQAKVNGGGDAATAAAQLLAAVQSEQALVNLNDDVSAGLRPLLLLADQAAAEQTKDGQSFVTQYSGVASALYSAQTAAQLTAVQQQMTSLHNAATGELAADKCGHNVGSGKVITINLTLQEAVFYDNGCAVAAGPVTTGRPELRTPTGTFHVFYKQSPFEFISPWPKTSPFYYFPSWTNWVMEFAGGGYFIHDAPWEPDSMLGPGSENSSGASHGCVHLSHDLMRWAYSWTPMGTPVIVTS